MKGLRSLALIGLPALVLIGALIFWLQGGRYATTENAFVKADIAQIASETTQASAPIQALRNKPNRRTKGAAPNAPAR